jgi:hypothetical protein
MLGQAFGALHRYLKSVETLKQLLDYKVTEETKNKIEVCLKALKGHCQELELDETIKYIDDVMRNLNRPLPQADLKHALQTVCTLLENEANGRYVYHIKNGRYVYHIKKDKLALALKEEAVWMKIFERFPSITEDVNSALNCYMLNEPNACVFHLMRVAEIGLRCLAKERRVALPKGKPLEWGTWQDILREIKKKSDAINQWRAGPVKDAALEFYSGSLGEFEGFKDAYRNQIMHVRGRYDEHQAASLLLRVRDFMTRLSGKIDGKSIKAIRWGRK